MNEKKFIKMLKMNLLFCYSGNSNSFKSETNFASFLINQWIKSLLITKDIFEYNWVNKLIKYAIHQSVTTMKQFPAIELFLILIF